MYELRVIILVVLCMVCLSSRPVLADVPWFRFCEVSLAEGGEFETVILGETNRMVLVERQIDELPPQVQRVARHIVRSPAFEWLGRLFVRTRDQVSSVGSEVLSIVISDMFGTIGPVYVGYPTALRQSGAGLQSAHGFVVLSDFDGGGAAPDISLEKLVTSGYAPLALAHETAHYLMDIAYLPEGDPRRLSRSTGGRDIMSITDPYLAFSEGWAEAFEAMLGCVLEREGLEDVVTERDEIERLVRLRHTMLRRNRYLWKTIGERTGQTRNGLQIISTEGVCAYQLWRCMRCGPFADVEAEDAPGRLLGLMAETRPRTLVEFFESMLHSFPEYRDELARVFLEWTRYMTVSKEGGQLYKASYQTALRLKGKRVDGAVAQLLRREHIVAYQAYLEWKEVAHAHCVATGCVAPDLQKNAQLLWVERGLVRLSLNLATADELEDFFDRLVGHQSEHGPLAEQVVALRDAPERPGYWVDVQELSRQVPAQLAQALTKARLRFLSAERRRDEGSLAALLSGDRPLLGRLAVALASLGR